LGAGVSHERKLDHTVYEDVVRALMGSDAYLLFVFDNLIKHVRYTPSVTLPFVADPIISKTLPIRGFVRPRSQSVPSRLAGQHLPKRAVIFG